MKIESLNLQRLRNEEHFQFHTETTDLVDKYQPETLGIGMFFPFYRESLNQEKQALTKTGKSEFTDDIASADTRRDNILIGFSATVRAAEKHFDPMVKEAAGRIGFLLDKYGRINDKSYEQETAAVNNLIEELEHDCLDELMIIHLEPWLDQLRVANRDFENRMQQRYSEMAGKTPVTMTIARGETDGFYHQITERINALVIVNGPQAYQGFIDELNERVEKYQLILAQRKGRNSKNNEANNDNQEPE